MEFERNCVKKVAIIIHVFLTILFSENHLTSHSCVSIIIPEVVAVRLAVLAIDKIIDHRPAIQKCTCICKFNLYEVLKLI